MKLLVVVLLVCLLVAGTVSAKAASSSLVSPVANPAIANPGIFTLAAYTGCSEDSASVGTAVGMGDLNVDSIPGGASVMLDGSPWTSQHCIGTWPTPTCFSLPIYAPYTGNVATGSHTITLALPGYTSYSGTVDICDQKVSYVHKTLNALPPASITVTTTAPATTTTTVVTTTTTTVATTTAAASVATSATTVPVTVVTSVPATSAPLASVPASGTSSTAVPQGSGSLTITTTPAGATVYLDGIQQGVSPAVIPGIPQGSHTILLKLDGYKDLSAPVYVTAGIRNDFSTGLTPLPPVYATAPPATTGARSPGFEAVFGLCALGTLLYLRNGSRR